MGRPGPFAMSKEASDGGLRERPRAGANLAMQGKIASGLNQQRPNKGVAVMRPGFDEKGVV